MTQIVEQLNARGTTVQVLGVDPYSATKFLQVHNRLEVLSPGAPVIPMYGGKSKPPAIGNPGGGMEPNELELFEKSDPELYKYYSSFGTMTPMDLQIIGCALRESRDETGFFDLRIVLDENTKKPVILTDFYYKEGHRVLTVWGKYNSYQTRPIKESDEIDYADWIDFSSSMLDVYRRLRRDIRGDIPVYPYWSHLRRIVASVTTIDRYNRDTDERPYLIRRLIHPSWSTVFRVGRGDQRFPSGGYLICPEDWYYMFDIMMEKGIENLDNDTLLSEFNGRSKVKTLAYDMARGVYELKERTEELKLANKIAFAKEQQDRILEASSGAPEFISSDLSVGGDIAGVEDYTGIPTSAEAIAREDEEYFKALEREFGPEWYRN